MQESFMAFVLFLLAIPVSVLLIVSFAKLFERRPGSTATIRYMLALVAHGVLAVAFFRLTTGQLLGRIWWGHEVVLLIAFIAVAVAPGVRRLTDRAKFVSF